MTLVWIWTLSALVAEPRGASSDEVLAEVRWSWFSTTRSEPGRARAPGGRARTLAMNPM